MNVVWTSTVSILEEATTPLSTQPLSLKPTQIKRATFSSVKCYREIQQASKLHTWWKEVVLQKPSKSQEVDPKSGTFPSTPQLESHLKPSRLVAYVAACIIQCSMCKFNIVPLSLIICDDEYHGAYDASNYSVGCKFSSTQNERQFLASWCFSRTTAMADCYGTLLQYAFCTPAKLCKLSLPHTVTIVQNLFVQISAVSLHKYIMYKGISVYGRLCHKM